MNVVEHNIDIHHRTSVFKFTTVSWPWKTRNPKSKLIPLVVQYGKKWSYVRRANCYCALHVLQVWLASRFFHRRESDDRILEPDLFVTSGTVHWHCRSEKSFYLAVWVYNRIVLSRLSAVCGFPWEARYDISVVQDASMYWTDDLHCEDSRNAHLYALEDCKYHYLSRSVASSNARW